MIQATGKLRMAVIGCGPLGRLHARAIAQSPHAVLAAVCDTDQERAAATAHALATRPYTDAATMLQREGLAAVTVATPDHLHVDVTLAALASGCHVFCEKPLAADADDARRLVAAAEQNGLSLAVDYNRRYGFGYRKARELLEQGTIGPVGHTLLRVTDIVPPPAVVRHPHVILTRLLTHHIDLLRLFCGEVHTVHAAFGAEPPGAVLRNVVLSFQFEEGAVGVIVAGYREGQTRTAERMELGGSKGTITVEEVTRCVTLTTTDPDRLESFRQNHFAVGDAFYDSVMDHVADFIERVAGGLAPQVTGRDGLRGLEVVAAAVASHEQGKPVRVSP